MRARSADTLPSNAPLPVKTITDYPARHLTDARPLISVITVVRNGAAGLARTIQSVASQDLPHLEYIVIDGGSTDGTLDIIQAHSDSISYWQSEADAGISDGFNKGIAHSHGKYVTLVHADDWLSPDQLKFGIQTLEESGADFVFGDLLYYRDGVQQYRIRGECDYAQRIRHVMPALNHPTVIVRRTAYEHLGLFDTDFKLAMDYELLLRFHMAGLRGQYDARVTGNMSLDGASDRNAGKGLVETRHAAIRYGYPIAKAWALYIFRLLKSSARRTSERALPRAVYQAIRGKLNRNFDSAS